MSDSDKGKPGRLEAGSAEGPLTPEVRAAAAKVINVNHLGVIQLNAPEAEWLMNATAMTVNNMEAATKSGQVMLAQQRQHQAMRDGIAALHMKARRAFEELLPAYQAAAEAARKEQEGGS